jgi:hypothetical protein
MGYNSTRPFKRRPTDILFVGAAFVVAAALVVWAFLG